MNLLMTWGVVLLIGSSDGFLSSSVHFGNHGDNITVRSRFQTKITAQMSWFRQDHSGNVTMVKFFSTSFQDRDRYFVADPVGSETLLTVTKATTADSGRYFAVMRTGVSFEAGTVQDVVVTDQVAFPVMHVFLQSGPARMFLCEVTGAGQGWSELYWVADDWENDTLESETIRSFDEDGLFTKLTILIPPDRVKAAVCVCRHETTGTTIQSVKQTTDNGVTYCNVLPLVGLLAGVLLLLAGVSAAVRFKRRGCATA